MFKDKNIPDGAYGDHYRKMTGADYTGSKMGIVRNNKRIFNELNMPVEEKIALLEHLIFGHRLN